MWNPQPAPSQPSVGETVVVEAPARLHLGFVDVSGSLGRRFGSLGLAIGDLSTVVALRRGEGLGAEGPSAGPALEHLRRLADAYDTPSGFVLTVRRAIPEHAGLGSGTQLAFAVARAFAALEGLLFDAKEVATRLDRGARSGIGIGTFAEGGFVVDGGRAPGGAYPPVVARLPFPAPWRVVLFFDRGGRGLHGDAERAAFQALRSFPQSRAAHLAHLLLMRAMPALAEWDHEAFGAAVGEIQREVGDHFAAAQGGRFASERVAAALRWCEARGIAGVGQTSWGPTGFAIVESELRAHALLAELRSAPGVPDGLDFQVVAGRNRGHGITIERADDASAHEGSAPPRKGIRLDPREDPQRSSGPRERS